MAETTKKPAEPTPEEIAAAEALAAAQAAAAEAAKAEAKTEAAKPPSGARGRGGKPKVRMETFEAKRPDGKVVTIVRNIDTGEQNATVQE
ncbi:hypothetical protein [Specibacter sp. NPDC078692]|uniref:hypothetical protein n=1 Tax=Specibacter sp. NPDC078692 TaxID=3155818 RepID=UPI00342338DC